MMPVLQGMRVLELSTGVAGAVAGKLLADIGANVVLLEPPAGHPMRRLEPVDTSTFPPSSPAFAYLGANKRSLTLDVSRESGRRLLRQLLGPADVLVTDLPPASLAKLRLQEEAVRRAAPGLVWAAITPFGLTGPYRDHEATELTLQAVGGFLYTFGDPDRPPLWSRGHQMEFMVGLVAASAVLWATRAAAKSGEGGVLDVAAMEAVVTLLEYPTTVYAYSGHVRQRTGGRRQGHYLAILPCKDGYVGINTVTPENWEMLCRAFQVEHLLADPRFATGPLRAAHAEELDAVFGPKVAKMGTREFYEFTQQFRIPCGIVASPADLAASAQFADRGFWQVVEDPVFGSLRIPGLPFKVDGLPWTADRAAPRVGEHTGEVLGEWLSLDGDAVTTLHAEGVV